MNENRILIVDNDRLNVMILEEILQEKFSLEKAYSGEEAIEKAEKFRPDIVLLDIMMPGMDGYEVCKKLRNNHALSFVKIILVSAKNMLSERLQGYDAGADDYIVKPFEPEEILAKVKVFLRLKSAEEINRTKENLLNLFSHETRTPLNAIIGFATILLNGKNLGGQELESANHILESGQQLLDFVNKTILINDFKKGNKTANLQKLDMAEVVLTSLEDAQKNATNKKLKFKKIFPEHKIFADADRELLSFSIKCLIDNAIRFSPENSSVEVSMSEDERRLILKISDSGPGIENHRLSQIFSEFNIEDIEHHDRGHGLSLALVKHIADLHGGQITAENNSGKPGCTFCLSLPKYRTPDPRKIIMS